MIRGGPSGKKENVANRHAQERAEHIARLISSYGAEGVEQGYIVALLQLQHGVDPRKSKQIIGSLVWMDKVRRAGTKLYTTNIETQRLSEQVDLQGQPTSTEEVREGEGVLELLSRVRTHSTSSPSADSQNNPTDQEGSA